MLICKTVLSNPPKTFQFTDSRRQDMERVSELLRSKRRRSKNSIHNAETDAKLFELYSKYGPLWRTISAEMGGHFSSFSEDACRNRVIRVLQKHGKEFVPSVERRRPTRPVLRGKWTKTEDELLFTLMIKKGYSDWEDLIKNFPGRTKQALRNRSQRIIRLVRECDSDPNKNLENALAHLNTQVCMRPPPGHRNRRKSKEKEEEEEKEEDEEDSQPEGMSSTSTGTTTTEEELDTFSSSFTAECEEFQLYMPSVTQDVGTLDELDDLDLSLF